MNRTGLNLILKTLLISLYVVLSAPLFGIPWKFDNSVKLSKTQITQIRQKFPSIESVDDATALLTTIASADRFEKVDAEFQKDSLIVIAKKSRVIESIEVSLDQLQIEQKISSKLKKFIKQADSQSIKDEITTITTRNLQFVGYYEPDISISTEKISNDKVTYKVNVDPGIPCLIRQINFSFKKPRAIALSIQEGDICDSLLIANSVNEIEARLREDGFNDISIDQPHIDYDKKTHSASVTFTGSIGSKVTYDIKYSSAQSSLAKLLSLREINTIDKNITSPDSMLTQLQRNYIEAGYDEVKISPPEKTQPRKNTIKYVFTVDPGPRYRVAEVQLEGLTIISQANALQTMELVPKIGSSVIFTRATISKSINNLKRYYNELGYWDIEIEYPRVIKNPEAEVVNLIFIIKEGKKRVIRNMNIEGNSVFKDDEILSHFRGRINSPLLKKDLIDFERSLNDAYKKRGKLYTKIMVDLLLDRKYRDIQTTVNIKIKEGPFVRFGDITIQGVTKTEVGLIRRALRFKTGDIYDPEAINASREDITALGLFSFISIRPDNPSDLINQKQIIDYRVAVTEAKPGMVAFGPAWSLNEGGRFSFETSYLNLQGMGRQIYFKGSLVEEKDQIPFGNRTLLGRDLGISLIEPYILETPFNASISFNHRAEADKDIWEISRSVELSLKHNFRYPLPDSSITLYSLLRSTRIETESDSSQLILISKDDVQIRELGFRYMLDSRDSISWPTKGIIYRGEIARASMALGGDTAYVRLSNSIGFYHQMFDSLVFAFGIATDTYRGIVRRDSNADILPASEVFKSGGANTNRGFKENELGPILRYTSDSGETKSFNTGGSQRFSLKTELRHQVIADTAAMSVFVDLGNTFFSNKEKSIIDQKLSVIGAQLYDNEPYEWDEILYNPEALWEKNYLSYGIAFSYLSPLGSINLSYGFPLKQCLGSDDCIKRGNADYKTITGGQVHISVGATF